MMKKTIDLIGDDIHYGKVIFVTNSANNNLAKQIRKFLIKKRSIWKREDNGLFFGPNSIFKFESELHTISIYYGYSTIALKSKFTDSTIDLLSDDIKPKYNKKSKGFYLHIEFGLKEKKIIEDKHGFFLTRSIKRTEVQTKKISFTPMAFPNYGGNDIEEYNSFLNKNEFNIDQKVIDSLYDLNKEVNGFMKESVQKMLNDENNKKERELKKKEEFKSYHSNLLSEFDKDGNGKLDTIELKDEFQKLLTKHQSIIVKEDKTYIQQFVKIANYHKQKRENLQIIFSSIKKSKNKTELNKTKDLLKEQIHSYELLIFHSLNMLTSLITKDYVTFYEIHTAFDSLKIFNSNHQNEVSYKLSGIENKLDDIKGGLYNLVSSIQHLELSIISELNQLTYLTQSSFKDLSYSLNKELNSIGSSINTNNLLTAINTYQNYSTNKRLNS